MLNRAMRSRGQALLETGIAVPLAVLTIAGVLYASKTATVRERLQLSARYAGLLLSYGDTYSDFSMYAVDQGRGSAAAPTACASPAASAVNGVDHTGTESAPFYQTTAVNFTASCNIGASGASIPNFMSLQDPKYTYGHVFLSRAFLSQTADTGRNPFLNTPGMYSVKAAYVRTPTLGVLMQCYPDIRTAVTRTTEAFNDTSTPSTAATPLPDQLTYTALNVDATCSAATTQVK